MGEVARQFGRVLAQPASPTPWSRTTRHRADFARSPAVGVAKFDINLICVNADELPIFFPAWLTGYHRPHATVAVWAWEVAAFPEWMRPSDHLVDEIWV